MRELYVFCEGPTEQRFCSQVLRPHLFPKGDGLIHTIKIANKKDHGTVHRGGTRSYSALKRDIENTLKQRPQKTVFFTTLLDLYALPSNFPGKIQNIRNPGDPRPFALALEQAFAADIQDSRFVAHLQLHEFETMLFADPEAFEFSFDHCDDAIENLKELVRSVKSIEHINDTYAGAPSRRIIDLIPQYEGSKSIAGPDIAEYIGLPGLRAKCTHLDQWVRLLETLPW